MFYLNLLIAFLCIDAVASFIDPFSNAFVVGTAVSSALFMVGEYVGLFNVKCRFGLTECCSQDFINPNMSSFKTDLYEHLYGQHIAESTVYKAIRAHVINPNPSKPLVMSFHGWTGGGKNHVARMIVRHIYAKGEKSVFVHVFNAERHFKHPHEVPLYKDQLQMWIHGNVSRCSNSIFIFDEMDHMPEGLIDALKPFLEVQPSFDEVDYRKTIFIFLSNTGGGQIVEHCLGVWNEGRSRDSITLSEMQEILMKSAYNQKSGLRSSGVIHKNLIDHFIPFLPLERDHVRKCIEDEIMRSTRGSHKRQKNHYVIQQVLEELLWFPNDLKLYSRSGCKKIAQKVALHLERDDDDDEL